MNTSSFFKLINSTEGTYMDLNFSNGRIANLLIDNTSTPRHFILVTDLSSKSLFRKLSDTKNKIINLKKGSFITPDSRTFNEVVSIKEYYKPSIINLGDSPTLLEHILRYRDDGTVVIFEKLSEGLNDFLIKNSLKVEFVSEENFYYITKGNNSRKSTNTLASNINSKVGRDISPNLT